MAGHSRPATPQPDERGGHRGILPAGDRALGALPPPDHEHDERHDPERHGDRTRQPDEQRHGRRHEPPLPRQRVEVADEQQHRERLRVGQLQRDRRGEARPQGHDEVCRRVADAVAQQQSHDDGRREPAEQGDRRRDHGEVETGHGHDAAGEVGEERVERPGVLAHLARVGHGQGRGIAVLGDELVPLAVPERGEGEVADRHVVAAGHAARHLLAHHEEQDRRRDDPRQRVDARAPTRRTGGGAAG